VGRETGPDKTKKSKPRSTLTGSKPDFYCRQSDKKPLTGEGEIKINDEGTMISHVINTFILKKMSWALPTTGWVKKRNETRLSGLTPWYNPIRKKKGRTI
jgi:hypothetical protein